MRWSDVTDIRSQLERRWEKGELLRDLLREASQFPLRIALRTPDTRDITERFDAVRAWASGLAAGAPIRLEWTEIRHRVQGTQRLPCGAWIDSLDGAVAWLGKQQEIAQFRDIIATTRKECPAAVSWLEKRPLEALALAPDWSRLLAVVRWLRDTPRPGIYLRQVDLPGVHSKFIESHRRVLAELLDLVLPADQINSARTGVGHFSARYGFREKPVRLRFRLLDPQVSLIPGAPGADITLDEHSFSRLDLPLQRVFITENETNFLAFPPVSGAMILFGAGYGWEGLASADWLTRSTLFYWGDIDTHGFAILDQLRARFPAARSFLMDRATLEAHASAWGQEDTPVRAELGRLSVPEHALYDDLRHDRIRPGLRLEQEHVRFQWCIDRLAGLSCQSD
ncbi:DUF3322 domain-containing protein [Tahibacter amnicola]|uniref:DUF3322 domain-containing protein n=1 Tax=Tahibacter amnicola TaxID=2976241 RepID=A0ABY6BK73_9GAMM|nr:DUF3322 domain-containing protein [Tahibacter amnicola]UXI69793.1 DUF3322 domain-containing protein [Tahibacter amnicola]